MDHRTLWKSSQLRLPAEVLLLIAQSFLPVHESCGFWDYNPLLSFCLVCKAWRPICQRKLFENVILRDAHHFDKLCNPKGATASADPLTYIHRIHFTYGHSCYKLGEVISRLVKLSLPNLKCLEISSSNGALGSDPPAFPIHHSFRIYTSRLPTIRFLKIGRFKFTHLAEFRRFLGIFGGLHRLEVEDVRLGPDRQGDCRPLYGTQNQSLRVVTGDFVHANSLEPFTIHPIFWINDRHDVTEPVDVTSETIGETVGEIPCPALTPDAARLLVGIHELLRDMKAKWTCMDGKKQQWKLASYNSNDPSSYHSLWAPRSVSASNRLVFSLSDLRSIQVNQEYVCMEEKVEDSFNSYKLLDDLLSRSENLEEFDVNVTTLVTDGPGRDEGVPDEVLLGHGQHIAETLQQVRQSCNLNICYGLTRKPVCWRHLFEQDVIVEDRNDYRKQTYNFFSQVKRKRLEWEELKKAEEEEQKMTKEWYKWEKGEEGGTVSRISQTGPCDPRTCLHPLPHFDERQTRLVRAPPAPFGRGLENLPFGISSPSPLEIPVYGSSLIPLVTSPTILGSERNQPFESFISPYSDGDVKAPPMELFALPDFCGSVNPSASTGSSVFSDWMDSGPNEEFDKRLHSHSAGRVNSPMTIFLSPTEFSEGIDPPTNAGSSPAFLDWTDSELLKVNLIDGCKIFGH